MRSQHSFAHPVRGTGAWSWETGRPGFRLGSAACQLGTLSHRINWCEFSFPVYKMGLDCVVSQMSPLASDRGNRGLMGLSEDKYLTSGQSLINGVNRMNVMCKLYISLQTRNMFTIVCVLTPPPSSAPSLISCFPQISSFDQQQPLW